VILDVRGLKESVEVRYGRKVTRGRRYGFNHTEVVFLQRLLNPVEVVIGTVRMRQTQSMLFRHGESGRRMTSRAKHEHTRGQQLKK
jgi:hypothetical protein